MRLLLDTHILLWATENSPRLSSKARSIIDDPGNSLFFSVVSLWEIIIKAKLNRSDFEVEVVEFRKELLNNGFFELEFQSAHVLEIRLLPSLHKDPFDHAIIAQSRSEHLTLLTSDSDVASYGGDILKV